MQDRSVTARFYLPFRGPTTLASVQPSISVSCHAGQRPRGTGCSVARRRRTPHASLAQGRTDEVASARASCVGPRAASLRERAWHLTNGSDRLRFMKPLPETQDPIVLRTDFSDDAAWEAVCAEIDAPDRTTGSRAGVEFVSDVGYTGLSIEQIWALIPEGSNHTFIFVVDRVTLSQPEHPILVVDLFAEPGRFTEPVRTFRTLPSEICGIQANLRISNMDFEEFADNVDDEGVFRGFRG